MALISVVMAVCDSKSAVVRGIETTLCQSLRDFEFVVVDDHSNPITQQRLREYAAADARIRVLRNDKRLRLASSLNRAIDAARCQYIARADANVSYEPHRLERQLRFLESHPEIDVLGSNFYWAVEGEQETRPVVLPEFNEAVIRRLSIGNCMCHPSVVFRKSRLMAFGPYREGFGKAQDYDLWMRARSRIRFHNVQDFLLTKWHRSEPWKEVSRLEYFKGNLRAHAAGLLTSPCLCTDVVCFPMVLASFVADTWVHRLMRHAGQARAKIGSVPVLRK